MSIAWTLRRQTTGEAHRPQTTSARLASLTLVVALWCIAAGPASGARIFTGRGDLNNDGNVNAVDVMIMENCLDGSAGGCGANPCIINKTDLDGDNMRTLTDLSILNAYVNNPAAFEAELATDSTTIYNYTTDAANNFHCRLLFIEAYESLNFPPPQGFRRGDDLFCGDHYLAWIDNTGFHGKLNGLWRLDGGSAPDFAYGPDGMLRNMLVAAENRNGQWHPGYSGSMHLEVLNPVPEANDNPNCSMPDIGLFCNGYAINEAGSYSTTPWWQACNPGSPGYDVEFPALTNEEFGVLSRRIVHESLLTKEYDGDAFYDGDACHQNFLFPDGMRRPMYIQLGWELYGQEPRLVQTVAVRNPNPPGSPLTGPQRLIVGAVLSDLSSPPPGKAFRNYVMPVDGTAEATCICPPGTTGPGCGETRHFPEGEFKFNGMYPICPAENPLDNTHASHQWIVSSVNGFQIGRTVGGLAFRPDGLTIRSLQPCECYANHAFEINVGMVDWSTLGGGQMTGTSKLQITLY